MLIERIRTFLASRNGAFSLLFAVTITTAAGNTALQSVLPAIGREIGISDTLIAGVFSLSALAWTVTSAPWARVSDRKGRKPLLQIGLVGFSLSMALFAAAVWAGLNHLFAPMAVFTAMIVGRSIYGFVGSAATPAAQAYIADRTAREERTVALATLASAIGLGTVLGPALAPFFVLPVLGLAGPMVVFVAIGLTVLFAVTRFLPSKDIPIGPHGERPTHAEQANAKVWRDPNVAPFVAYGFVLASAQAVNVTTLGFQVIDRMGMEPVQAQHFIGLAMFAGAIATVMSQWGLIRMFRMTPRALLRWGAALALIGNLIMVSTGDYYGLVVGYAVMSLGYGFARPGFTAGGSLAGRAEDQGAIAGVMGAVNGACYIVGPMVGVFLYERFGPTPFLINVALLLGLFVAAIQVKALARAGEAAAVEAAPVPSVRTGPPPP